MTVVAGTNKLNDKNRLQYKIDYKLQHEKYNGTHNDIGLLHVAEPIEFNDKVKAIPIQNEPFDETNTTATLTGWGVTEVWIKLSIYLFLIFLKVTFFTICINYLLNFIER